MKAFKNSTVYLDGIGLTKCSLIFDENILSINQDTSLCKVINLPNDAIVLPGFIDQHIHGAGGSDTMDATVSDLKNIALTLAKEGTTGFLATTMTQSKENICNALKAVKDYKELNFSQGAELIGVHLEGPFISPKFKGAQPLEFVCLPNIKLFDEFNKVSGNCIKIVTLAPEMENASIFIQHLKSQNIVVSIGHSGAKYDDVVNAVENGATNVTHAYNAQSPLHHREIGVVGSSLLIENLNLELIADTVHVSIPAIKLLLKNKSLDKITLITDAMRAKGMSDGQSELGGQTVIVKDGEARLIDGTLAGSVLKMNYAIKNMVTKVGLSIEKAVDLATIVPAKTLGIDGSVGSIKVGKRANFAVINGNFDLILTVRNGKIIYEK